jgi:hypothetical protein
MMRPVDVTGVRGHLGPGQIGAKSPGIFLSGETDFTVGRHVAFLAAGSVLAWGAAISPHVVTRMPG